MGFPGRNLEPSKRGTITGWSSGAVRRHKRWLYGVKAEELTGTGAAITLTLRDIPPSSVEWREALSRLHRTLRTDARVTRWHYVVEWQRRGAPHVHLAVYGHQDPTGLVVDSWLNVASDFSPERHCQRSTPIYGPVGWLKYLSKHASRGVKHYQRQGKPPGWETTGKLWGYGGSWPSEPEIHGELNGQEFYRLRRLVRRWAIADARTRGDFRAVGYLRRAHKKPDPNLSAVLGISEWVPGPLFVQMAVAAGWQGQLVEPTPTVSGVRA